MAPRKGREGVAIEFHWKMGSRSTFVLLESDEVLQKDWLIR